MDETNDNFELTSDQTEKVLQFQDLTGIEDLNQCKQILERNNWDFEISVRLTLDGNIHTNSNSSANSDSGVRQRLVANSSANSTSEANPLQTNNNNEYRRAETGLSVWSLTTRLISLPLAFIYDTFLSFIRFALSLIRTDQITSESMSLSLN